MNAKEMEALIIAQGREIQELRKAANADDDWSVKLQQKLQEQVEAHMHLVQRADNIVEGFKQELAVRDERIRLLEELHDARRDEIEALTAKVEALTADVDNHRNRLAILEEKTSEMRDQQDGMNDTLFGATTRIEKLETLVLARNASAATKRNMTDEDALRVLTGDLRDVAHKDAAEKIGLTYAQVYSCRLEFTFKHVHKDLRDNVKDWKNPWSK